MDNKSFEKVLYVKLEEKASESIQCCDGIMYMVS